MDVESEINDVETTVENNDAAEQIDSGIVSDASSESYDSSYYQSALSYSSTYLGDLSLNHQEEDENNKEAVDIQLDHALEDNVQLIIQRDDEGNDIFSLNMSKSASITDVLNQVTLNGNFIHDEYDLSIDDKILPRNITLRDAAIIHGSRLRLIERSFQIFIRRIDGRVLTMNVRSSNNIEYLKEQFNYTDQVPIHQQRLLYQSQELENSKTLQYYKIPKNATLEMVYRLRGGA